MIGFEFTVVSLQLWLWVDILRSIDTDTDSTWDTSILEILGLDMVGIQKLIGFWYYVKSGVRDEKKKKKAEILGINCLLEGTSNRTQLISILSSLKFVLVKLMGEKTLSGRHNVII